MAANTWLYIAAAVGGWLVLRGRSAEAAPEAKPVPASPKTAPTRNPRQSETVPSDTTVFEPVPPVTAPTSAGSGATYEPPVYTPGPSGPAPKVSVPSAPAVRQSTTIEQRAGTVYDAPASTPGTVSSQAYTTVRTGTKGLPLGRLPFGIEW